MSRIPFVALLACAGLIAGCGGGDEPSSAGSGDQRRAVTGAGSTSSKDWFSPAMAHTNE